MLQTSQGEPSPPLRSGAICVCPPGCWGRPGPRRHPAAPPGSGAAGAGDAGEADAEKLVTAESKTDHSAGLTHHSTGKGFCLP